MCVCVSTACHLRVCLFVPDTDRYAYPGWVLALGGQEGRAGCGLGTRLEEEEGTGGVERQWGLRLWPWDWWLCYRERAHPRATAPQHQTCPIMLIYGDGWAVLSTESGQVHQRIYLFTRLKGAKASAKQRLTLRVSSGPGLRDLHWDNLQIIGRSRRQLSGSVTSAVQIWKLNLIVTLGLINT